MYDIVVEHEFAAAHQLRGYLGKCERLHGHSWKVALELSVRKLDALGLGMDFNAARALLSSVTESFDHICLNELPAFSHINPTSENLARVIFQACKIKLKIGQARVKAVTVWESARAYARYYE